MLSTTKEKNNAIGHPSDSGDMKSSTILIDACPLNVRQFVWFFLKILIIFVVQKFQNHNIIHYLDDDLFVGEQNTGTLHCVKLAEIVKLTCRELGIPINEKKKTPNY